MKLKEIENSLIGILKPFLADAIRVGSRSRTFPTILVGAQLWKLCFPVLPSLLGMRKGDCGLKPYMGLGQVLVLGEKSVHFSMTHCPLSRTWVPKNTISTKFKLVFCSY